MNRRRLAALFSHAQCGDGPEALLARSRIEDLCRRGKVSEQDLQDIGREVSGQCAAPPVAFIEPWRSALAAAVTMDHGCRSFWRSGAVHFVGAGASAALSDYMRLATDCDGYALRMFERERERILSFDNIWWMFDSMGGIVSSILPQAQVLWVDMFRAGFARVLLDRVRGVLAPVVSPTVSGGSSSGAEKPVSAEVKRADALADRIGVERVAELVARADALGAAAGSRVSLRAIRRLPGKRKKSYMRRLVAAIHSSW